MIIFGRKFIKKTVLELFLKDFENDIFFSDLVQYLIVFFIKKLILFINLNFPRMEILKGLMEAQFDFNLGLLPIVEEMSVEELRQDPTGIDVEGHRYWVQVRETAAMIFFLLFQQYLFFPPPCA